MTRFLQKLLPKCHEALIYKEFESVHMKEHERSVSLVMPFGVDNNYVIPAV